MSFKGDIPGYNDIIILFSFGKCKYEGYVVLTNYRIVFVAKPAKGNFSAFVYNFYITYRIYLS